jgi:hypothetical protein
MKERGVTGTEPGRIDLEAQLRGLPERSRQRIRLDPPWVRGLLDYLGWQALGDEDRGARAIQFRSSLLLRGASWLYKALLLGLARPARITPEPCDVLLVQPAKQAQENDRKGPLIREIERRGLTVRQVVHTRRSRILRSGEFAWPGRWPGLRFLPYAVYAAYLTRRFHSKVIITVRNSHPLSFFLRRSGSGAFTAHLAHSVTTPDTRGFAFIDYDYYLLYGRGSLAMLKRRDVRFGNTCAVLAGSFLLDEGSVAPPVKGLDRVLILGMGPSLEARSRRHPDYELLAAWVERHPELEFRIRLHPRSTIDFWIEESRLLPNLSTSRFPTPISDDIGWSDAVVGTYTNAIVEAAALGRPVLIAGCEAADGDPFDAREYLALATTVEELDQWLEGLSENMQPAIESVEAFAAYLLERRTGSVRYLADVIVDLHAGRAVRHERLEGTV